MQEQNDTVLMIRKIISPYWAKKIFYFFDIWEINFVNLFLCKYNQNDCSVFKPLTIFTKLYFSTFYTNLCYKCGYFLI